jgi:hypothetical protein
MSIGEILFIIVLGGGFLIPTALFKQWRLFSVFAVFFAVFGLLEWLSVAQTGMSISQHFWALDNVNPAAGWWIVGGMAIGWAALLIHFKFRKKKG